MYSETRPYVGAHLRWPVERRALPFAVRVLEPRLLKPAEHAHVLNAVVQDLVSPSSTTRDRFDDVLAPPTRRRYDLVTFPEAFATADAVVAVASAIASQGPSGCLHMGLRPDEDGSSHLFSVAALTKLLADLQALVDTGLDDLAAFAGWLDRQVPGRMFNVGCMLAVDAHSRLRVCLHPKLVRSKFEVDRLPERHMHEADLLTLVTLVPVSPRFGTVTLQPLICSDALNLETDRGARPPISAVTLHAECLVDPPNHVDVVSIATCTPQPRGTTANGRRYRAWHTEFLDAFVAAAQNPECARHHFAIVVLANYTEISDRLPGGLSGAFLPVAPGFRSIGSEVAVSCWGRPAARPNNGWSDPDDDPLTSWSNRGFVAGLDPDAVDATDVARLFAFDVLRLPRETSPWRSSESLVALEVRTCNADSAGTLTLQTRDNHV